MPVSLSDLKVGTQEEVVDPNLPDKAAGKLLKLTS
jgi:hypothetical protein